jgi:hypothetical protein
MTMVLERAESERQAAGSTSPSPDSISLVLTPLLHRLDDSLCTHRTDGLPCGPCSTEVAAVVRSAAGTAAPLPEPDLRSLLLKIASYEEREVCDLCPAISLTDFCIASMKISDNIAVVRAAPIDDAVDAAAGICLTTYDAYSSSGQFRGGVRAADRVVNMFRVQVGMLARDLGRRTASR